MIIAGHMTTPCDQTFTEQPGPQIIPDLRGSLCHTIMAAGFFLINVQNPYRRHFIEDKLELFVMMAIPIAIGFSWYNFYKRFSQWRKTPLEVRNRLTRSPESLRNRAVSHLLMALLAAGLTALGYIGHIVEHAEVNPGMADNVFLGLDALVGIIAIATVSRTIRDLMATFRIRTR